MTKAAPTAVSLAVICLAGCGGSSASTDKGDAKVDRSPRPPVELTISTPPDGAETHDRTIAVKGDTEVGAYVTVNGDAATVAGTVWRAHATLDYGENDIEVTATKSGRTDAGSTVSVTRSHTAAQLAAIQQARAAARARRIAARQAAIAAFKASCQTIPYAQLEKNPDAFTGTKVTYTGQIFQIVEDSEGGGVMLLAVTDEGYDIWDDNVWVDYSGHVNGAKGDMATVWGFVAGRKTYDTQIGGSTDVPEIHAKFVAG